MGTNEAITEQEQQQRSTGSVLLLLVGPFDMPVCALQTLYCVITTLFQAAITPLFYMSETKAYHAEIAYPI